MTTMNIISICVCGNKNEADTVGEREGGRGSEGREVEGVKGDGGRE